MHQMLHNNRNLKATKKILWLGAGFEKLRCPRCITYLRMTCLVIGGARTRKEKEEVSRDWDRVWFIDSKNMCMYVAG